MSVAAKIVFNHLPAIQGQARGRASQVVRKTVADLEAAAKGNIVAMDAVDTGNLHNETRGTMKDDLNGEVGPQGVEYARYVHDGTVKMAGRPFLTNAADEVRPSFEAAMREIWGL